MKKILLLLFIILISGCAKAQPLLHLSQKMEENYQYSAPWDKEMFDNFYNSKLVPNSTLPAIKGGIIPHHLLAGKYIASFFGALEKQQPSVVVLIGPNHFSRGQGKIISSSLNWKTPFGILSVAGDQINQLAKKGLLTLDDKVVSEEHSIYGPINLLKKSLPKTKVLPIILKGSVADDELDKLVEELKNSLPNDAVVVASIDFSHYQSLAVAGFHDELSRGVIASFDYSRLKELEIDSTPSLYTLMRLMESFGTEKIVYDWYDNAANLTGKLDSAETTSYYLPIFGAGEPSQEKVASLLFFGDMMLDRNVAKRIAENNPDYLFTKLAGQENRFFKGVDIIHTNLEGPFANYRRNTSKEIAFRFDPALISTLKKYNFNLFTIANNHSLDMGSAGLAESKENLTQAEIEFYGDAYDIGSQAYIIKEIPARNASASVAGGGGIKIAFVGFNDTFFPLDKDKIINKIQEAKKQADFVIVNIHWGNEYQVLKSNSRQQELAHLMIDNGADVIIGHHPHVVQEMEIYKDKPIFYSLGNFIFDQYFSTETQQGLAVGLVVKQGVNKSISLYAIPLQGVNSQVSQMSFSQSGPWFKKFIDSSRLGSYNFDINKHLLINYEK